MKHVYRTLLFPLILLASFGFLVTAKAQIANDDNMIDIGGGIGSAAGANTIEAILRVRTNFIVGEGNGYFIAVRFNGDAALSSTDVRNLDIEVRALGYGFRSTDDLGVFSGFIEGTLLNVNLQRNIALDMNRMMTVDLFGLRMGAGLQITERIKLLAEMAFDVGTISMSGQRASDLANMTTTGLHSAGHFTAELALVVQNRLRVAIGYSNQSIDTNGYSYLTGTQTCNEVEDGYYSDYSYYDDELGERVEGQEWVSTGSHTECTDDTAVNYQEHWRTSTVYFSVMANLTKRLSIFAKAGYSVFTMSDELGRVGSNNRGWQFMFGVSYRIGQNH